MAKKEMGNHGLTNNKMTMSRNKNGQQRSKRKDDDKKNRGHKSKLLNGKLGWLKKKLAEVNLKSQKILADQLQVHDRTIRYYIDKFDSKTVKKPKNHAISLASQE